MAWRIQKRDNDYYYAVRDKKNADGKWGKDAVSLRTKNEIVAKRRLKELSGDKEANCPIEDVYEIFEKSIRQEGLDKKSVDKYLQHTKAFVGYMGKKVLRIKDIKKEHILDFLNYLSLPGTLTEEGASPSTISGYRRTLKKLFLMFEREDALDKNPMRWIKAGRMEKKMRFYTQDEIRLILTTAKEMGEYFYALVGYFFQTGLRIQGVVDSEWGNLNPERQTLKIKVKRKKQTIIRIPDLAFNAISKIKKGNKIFDTNRQKTIYADIKAILDKAKVEGYPHAFRDTYASYSLAIGVPITVVRDRLGHDSIATTDKYSHAINHRIDDDIKELFNDWEIRN